MAADSLVPVLSGTQSTENTMLRQIFSSFLEDFVADIYDTWFGNYLYI